MFLGVGGCYETKKEGCISERPKSNDMERDRCSVWMYGMGRGDSGSGLPWERWKDADTKRDLAL